MLNCLMIIITDIFKIEGILEVHLNKQLVMFSKTKHLLDNWWIRHSYCFPVNSLLKHEMLLYKLKSCSLWNNSHLHITSGSLSYQCLSTPYDDYINIHITSSFEVKLKCKVNKWICEKELIVVFFFKTILLLKTLYKGNLFNFSLKHIRLLLLALLGKDR